MEYLDVILLYEGRERELESVCLLACELKKYGLSVKILCVYPNREMIPILYSCKVLMTPWAYNDKDMKYLSCFYKYSTCKIINFHHEQYAYDNERNLTLPTGNAKAVYHISWGETFTSELLSIGCSNEKICQAGNIRLDFFKKRFWFLVKDKNSLAEEFKLDRNAKWVLFLADGYHLANDIKLSQMSTIDANARVKADIHRKIRDDFLSFLDHYLSCNNDTVFIYRPHPVLSSLEFQRAEIESLVKKYPNSFACVFKYPVKDWILNCDLSVSIHSTVGIEAYVASKPFYLFRTRQYPNEIDYPFYEKYPQVIRDYEDFLRVLQCPQVNNWSAIKEYYDIEKETYSYETICNFVLKIMNAETTNSVERFVLLRNAVRAVGKSLLTLMAKMPIILCVLKWIAKVDNRFNTIMPSFHDIADENEIRRIEEKIQLCIKTDTKE